MTINEVQAHFDLNFEALPRTPGIHVSHLLKEICLNLGLWKREDEDELDVINARFQASRGEDIVRLYPAVICRVAVGLAWEQFYGRQQDINFHGIGELARYGIIGTPDGLEFDDEGAIIHELKATWKSSRDDREEPQERLLREYYWTAQVASYAALSTVGEIDVSNPGLVTRGMLHVIYLNGNYRGSGPQLKVYQITYRPEEIVANWRMLMTKAEQERLTPMLEELRGL